MAHWKRWAFFMPEFTKIFFVFKISGGSTKIFSIFEISEGPGGFCGSLRGGHDRRSWLLVSIYLLIVPPL